MMSHQPVLVIVTVVRLGADSVCALTDSHLKTLAAKALCTQ